MKKSLEEFLENLVYFWKIFRRNLENKFFGELLESVEESLEKFFWE